MPLDITNIVLSGATVLSAATAAAMYFGGIGDRHRKQLDERIGHHVTPLDVRIKALEAQVEAAQSASADAIEAAINRALGPYSSKLDVLEAKMDVFWRQVALDAAKILHQPHPERAMLDHLLDAFTENVLTPDEELALRRELVRIRDWEPGVDLGYPVRDGEQTAAAILLRTMSHVTSPRGAP